MMQFPLRVPQFPYALRDVIGIYSLLNSHMLSSIVLADADVNSTHPILSLTLQISSNSLVERNGTPGEMSSVVGYLMIT